MKPNILSGCDYIALDEEWNYLILINIIIYYYIGLINSSVLLHAVQVTGHFTL